MKFRFTSQLSVVAMVLSLWTINAHAASITNYRTYKAAPATTLSGQGTDDPVVGDAATPASAAFVIGYLDTPAVLGDDTGDTVTFSFSVSFTDASGFSNLGDNFRFAIFDTNGEVAPDTTAGGPNYATAGNDNTDDFRGYILGHRGGGGAGAGGSIRERVAALISGDNAFAVTGANAPTAPSLGPVGGASVPLALGTVYDGVLTLTRNASGLVDVSGSFKDSAAATGNIFSAADLTPNSSSTYEAIGFLIGGPLSIDQASFTDIDVTAVPEPTSAILLACGAAGFVFSRRSWRSVPHQIT